MTRAVYWVAVVGAKVGTIDGESVLVAVATLMVKRSKKRQTKGDMARLLGIHPHVMGVALAHNPDR